MEKKEQKPRIEVMLDMETFDIAETAAIIGVALVPFSLDGSEVDEGYICHIINQTSCLFEGMTVGKKTQKWWEEQPSKAKGYFITQEQIPIRQSMELIYNWLLRLSEIYDVHLWCRGLNFDVPKLERCFRILLDKEEMPYPWWNLEDARCFCRNRGVHTADIEFVGTPHTPEDDCRHQIKLVQKAWQVEQHLQDCRKIVEQNTK